MRSDAPRLLIVRLTAIGDVVHTLPAAAALRRHLPGARIDWLVDRRAAAILDGVPIIDRRIVLDGKRLLQRPWLAWPALRELREVRYDAVFDLQGLFKSALASALARSSATFGFDDDEMREPFAGGLYSRRVSPPPASHVIARGLAMVGEYLDRPQVIDERWEFPLAADPARDAAMREQLGESGDDDHSPLIVINPGAGWLTKRWPAGRFAEVAHQLLMHPLPDGRDVRVMITWGPGEESARDAIRSRIPPLLRPRLFDFATTLPDLVAVLRRAALFVGGDTGPMQLAAALGTPTVALFGPTWPHRNGPFTPADRAAVVWHRLACSGCYGKTCRLLPPGATRLPECLERIAVTDVVAAIARRLSAS
ncbi:MAG: lipopolysaccharide heptosyltransferase I [Planctomycetota bacterium]